MAELPKEGEKILDGQRGHFLDRKYVMSRTGCGRRAKADISGTDCLLRSAVCRNNTYRREWENDSDVQTAMQAMQQHAKNACSTFGGGK